MPFAAFDRSQLKIKPLGERVHDMGLPEIFDLDDETPSFDHPDLAIVADRVVVAHRQGGQVILMMGAHMLKVGLSRFIIDLMERGIITHVAMNGAGPIHDFELALIGGSTESVARYIQAGQFGLWAETGRINEAIVTGAQDGIGLGEAPHGGCIEPGATIILLECREMEAASEFEMVGNRGRFRPQSTEGTVAVSIYCRTRRIRNRPD